MERMREGEDLREKGENIQSGIQMTLHQEDLRGIKKRERFKESDEMSERDFQYWIEWLGRNEKSLVDEIGEVFEKD